MNKEKKIKIKVLRKIFSKKELAEMYMNVIWSNQAKELERELKRKPVKTTFLNLEELLAFVRKTKQSNNNSRVSKPKKILRLVIKRNDPFCNSADYAAFIVVIRKINEIINYIYSNQHKRPWS